MKRSIAVLEQEHATIKHQSRSRKKQGDPWGRTSGVYASHPRFDEWQKEIAEYRREVDAKEEARHS